MCFHACVCVRVRDCACAQVRACVCGMRASMRTEMQVYSCVRVHITACMPSSHPTVRCCVFHFEPYRPASNQPSYANAQVTIDRKRREATFDFEGTGPQVFGNTNAPPAVTYSAIIYCLRCLVRSDIPLNQVGLLVLQCDSHCEPT